MQNTRYIAGQLWSIFSKILPHEDNICDVFCEFHVWSMFLLSLLPGCMQYCVIIHWSILSHWGRDKMVTIYQTTFSNAFSSMKMYKFSFIKISLKFIPMGRINNIPALIQIMALRRPGDKPLSESVVVSLLMQMHICVTQLQWVKAWLYCFWLLGKSLWWYQANLGPNWNNWPKIFFNKKGSYPRTSSH